MMMMMMMMMMMLPNGVSSDDSGDAKHCATLGAKEPFAGVSISRLLVAVQSKYAIR